MSKLHNVLSMLKTARPVPKLKRCIGSLGCDLAPGVQPRLVCHYPPHDGTKRCADCLTAYGDPRVPTPGLASRVDAGRRCPSILEPDDVRYQCWKIEGHQGDHYTPALSWSCMRRSSLPPDIHPDAPHQNWLKAAQESA